MNPRRVGDAELEQGGVGVDFKIRFHRRDIKTVSFPREFLQGQRVERHGIVAEPELLEDGEYCR